MKATAEELAASLRDIAQQQADSSELLEASLQRLVDTCTHLFGVTGCGLMLADEYGQLAYVVASGELSRSLEESQLAAGEGPCVESFATDTTVATEDVHSDPRWPHLAQHLTNTTTTGGADPVGAVLGTPVHLHGTPVGSLDTHQPGRVTWAPAQQDTLTRFAQVAEALIASAVHAHRAGRLAGQLEHAIAHRAPIERGVGYLMARDGLTQAAAFARLRQAARSTRRPITTVAQELLDSGRLPEDR